MGDLPAMLQHLLFLGVFFFFFFKIVRFLKIAFGNKGLRLGFGFPICEMEIVAAALLGG